MHRFRHAAAHNSFRGERNQLTKVAFAFNTRDLIEIIGHWFNAPCTLRTPSAPLIPIESQSLEVIYDATMRTAVNNFSRCLPFPAKRQFNPDILYRLKLILHISPRSITLTLYQPKDSFTAIPFQRAIRHVPLFSLITIINTSYTSYRYFHISLKFPSFH